MNTNDRLQIILAKADELNKQCPENKEVTYSQRMLQRLNAFMPEANETLVIAAYCQHIQRWIIPRSDYPMDKAGYKRWRTNLGQHHAETTAALMRETEYSEEDINRVEHLLQKKGLKRDPDTQALEDVICLVFLEYYLEDFSSKHNEEKLISIIQKTWNKMSEKGHDAALQLPLKSHLRQLVEKALTAA